MKNDFVAALSPAEPSLAHRADQVVAAEFGQEFPQPKLTAVGVDHEASDTAAFMLSLME